MDNAYVSARVRALENNLLGKELLDSLKGASNLTECIRLLNNAGIPGEGVEDILDYLSEQKKELTLELIDNPDDIEILFYKETFHNLKAAIKQLYVKGENQKVFYDDALVDGEHIMRCILHNKYESLPEYMQKPAIDAYKEILHTGNGQNSDIIVDKACLEAMMTFAQNTKYEVLKKYAYETVAASDIKLVLRGNRDVIDMAFVDCPYFTKEAMIGFAGDKHALEEFLKGIGFADINISNIDSWIEKRILEMCNTEKYNIFSPGPAICFILSLEHQLNLIRLILICKANGLKGLL